MFDSTTTSQNVYVAILDDDILEDNETFIGDLTTTDDRVDLHPVTATTVIIEDNDGKFEWFHALGRRDKINSF